MLNTYSVGAVAREQYASARQSVLLMAQQKSVQKNTISLEFCYL